jgi:hypothetical protein
MLPTSYRLSRWSGAAWVTFATVLIAMTTRHRIDGSRILVYPFGHCLNSHLLNAEKVRTIVIERFYLLSRPRLSKDNRISKAYTYCIEITSLTVMKSGPTKLSIFIPTLCDG